MAATEAELKSLMVAALAADRAAYRLLLGHARERLQMFFRRRLLERPADVDDLVQETLIAIHTRRETFDTAQPFTPWMYAIARYKLVDYLRRSGRAITVPLEQAEELSVADAGAAADARRDLEQALARLPERSRSLLGSVKLQGLSVAEAAARHGMSESAVKVGIHRSLRRLAAQLRAGNKADV
ncbi:MAG: sigma-70 family RNA polymerase sigma factor [Alphaproteobacteria bacterium]|nr:sigma-70 family RNA polymerase sigma factor [Alphaproteobacteria bacterium]